MFDSAEGVTFPMPPPRAPRMTMRVISSNNSGPQVRARVEQRKRQGQRVVDSGIAVDDHFAGHVSILGVRKTAHKADSRIRRQRTGDRRQSVIESYLGRVAAGEDLSAEAMDEVVGLLLDGKVPENEIAVLLTGLKHKG